MTEGNITEGYKIITDPGVLYSLKQAMKQRRNHKKRVNAAMKEYLKNGNAQNALRLMKAQEAARGSRARIKRLHDLWEPAVHITTQRNYWSTKMGFKF